MNGLTFLFKPNSLEINEKELIKDCKIVSLKEKSVVN